MMAILKILRFRSKLSIKWANLSTRFANENIFGVFQNFCLFLDFRFRRFLLCQSWLEAFDETMTINQVTVWLKKLAQSSLINYLFYILKWADLVRTLRKMGQIKRNVFLILFYLCPPKFVLKVFNTFGWSCSRLLCDQS